MIRRAAKGRTLVQILAALAVLAAVALPAGASIPRPGQLPELNPETLLAAAREAPAPQPAANSQDASFELFAEPIGDRFRLDLQAAADAPAEARFHLLTPPKTRVRGFRLPEPLVIGVELPPSRTAFRLYGDVPYGFASGGLYVTSDPLGYVDGPNLYQYGLNNPVNVRDPMGLVGVVSQETFEENAETRLGVQVAIEQAGAMQGQPAGGTVAAWLVDSILAYGMPTSHEEIFASFEEGVYGLVNPLAFVPGEQVVASKSGGVVRRFFRKLNPLRWFDDLGEATARGLREGAEEGIEELTPRLVEVPRGIPPLRQEYVEAVEGLSQRVPGMRASGMTSEEIARALHAERRALGVRYKELTPPDRLQQIYERNLRRYGDELGPSIEWLREQGKTWEQIIESATRTGGKDLGF